MVACMRVIATQPEPSCNSADNINRPNYAVNDRVIQPFTHPRIPICIITHGKQLLAGDLVSLWFSFVPHYIVLLQPTVVLDESRKYSRRHSCEPNNTFY